MCSQCQVGSDIRDWLATIRLERYKDAFEHHGYGSVRDAILLSKEDLQKLGITATGHCKRILNLVQQTRRLVGVKGEPMEADAHYGLGECTDSLGEKKDICTNNDVSEKIRLGPVTDHDAAHRNRNPAPEKEPISPVAKPVPKPRTVFPRMCQAAKSEQVSSPSVQTSSVHKPAAIHEGAPGAFITLEGFDPGESSTDAEKVSIKHPAGAEDKNTEITLSAFRGSRQKNSGTAPQCLVHRNEISSEVKHVSEPSFSSPMIVSSHKNQPVDINPTESIPAAATNVQRTPVSPPAALPKPPALQDRKEIVSNAIYDGREPFSLPANSMGAQGNLRNQPTALPPIPAMQNSSGSAENLAFPEQNLHHTPEGFSNNSDPTEESISPYCESTTGYCWPPQKEGAASIECPEYEELPGCDPAQREEGPMGRSTNVEEKSLAADLISRIVQNKTEGYSTVEAPPSKDIQFNLSNHLYPDELLDDLTISPYASYTSLSERPTTMLSGWLDKLSPQGNYVFQRRFVKFDGKNLMYFNNEKEPYPKGTIPLSVIELARSTKDNKFQVVTSHRIFVFRAENEALRNEWCSTLQQNVTRQRLLCLRPHLNSGTNLQKFGYLELKGYKSRLFVALTLAEIWLYKSEQFFKMGIAICMVEIHGTTIREAKGRGFELITPLKIFSFGAESEREKRDWMEALQNSIAETLYDYEVAEKIWSNKANRFCADCYALSPDWASINLCVVICKHCAGQHRSLGSSISKVQSLKLDTSIWSNEMVQLFIMLGNEQVNRFWAAHLPPSEALYPDANTEQRRDFITRKYRCGCYRMPHPLYSSQENILQALCAAVSGPGLLKAMLKFFATTTDTEAGNCKVALETKLWSGSIPNDQQGSVSGKLDAGELSPEGVYNEITQPVAHCGYLYKAPVLTKPTVTKKSREESQRVWCSLEKCLFFYESDRSSEPLGKIEVTDMISLGVNRTDMLTGPSSSDRCHFTLDLYLSNERMQQLGLDGPDTLQSWASAVGKWFTPLSCQCLLGYEFQKVGRLCYKSMLNPNQWLQGFFILQKSHLFLCPAQEGAAEDSINLRQLQELSIVPLTADPDKKEMLILVEMGRTFHLQGASRLDFTAWCSAIQASAGGQGNALRDQQLSRSGIPIIVNSCIAFITQYGLQHEGIYRKNGAKSRIKALMDEFRRDARNVKLRTSDNFIEDVTDVLKRFFRELEDPVFTTHLHPQWKEAAEIFQKYLRLERYKELISRLPHLNRRTLAALIGHLYRVQKCADLNQMTTKNLALLFAPSLFQTDGKGEHEVKVMEDLIDNYVHIFNINEDQVLQMDLENSLITTWRDVQLSQAGDLILEVYLEQKNPDCCVTLKVSPMMIAEELTNQVLEMRNVAASLDIWLTFEVLENGELERPLHPKEKVLEQALQWCKLAKPSAAYLLVKRVPLGEGSCLFTGVKRESPKCGPLKCREEPPKILGSKFHERYFVIKDRKLLLLKEKRSVKPDREWQLDVAKVYMGIRKKLKPPSQWGFTLTLEKQHLYLACTEQSELWDWTTSILKAQHDGIRPVILRRHSSSDVAKQKFGTMPLIPLRGDSTNPIMLSANQTLHRLHTRRTLSMFFPMKMHQDLLEEHQETPESEPVYEEVGSFPGIGSLELDPSLLPPVDRTKKPVILSEQVLPSSAPPCPVPRASGNTLTKAHSFERGPFPEPGKAPLTDKFPGQRPTQNASLEAKIELPQALPTPERVEEKPGEVQTLPPDSPAGTEAQAGNTKKKSFRPDLPICDKFMQELSTAVLRKNESQTPKTPEPPTLSSKDGDHA